MLREIVSAKWNNNDLYESKLVELFYKKQRKALTTNEVIFSCGHKYVQETTQTWKNHQLDQVTHKQRTKNWLSTYQNRKYEGTQSTTINN